MTPVQLPIFTYSPVPSVSLVLPVYNEGGFIAGCLESLLQQDYAQERVEILVVDGQSSDNTCEVVRHWMAAHPQIKLLENPERLQAHALNRGIVAANGEIVIRVDGHCHLAPDYVSTCVRLLREMAPENVVNVGGLMRPQGENLASRAIAAATTSPFGIPTAFHHAEHPAFVDTVYLGAWPSALFKHLGGFNPAVNVNEDYEFNYRIRQAGGKIYLHPAIRSTYFPRSSFTALWQQYFRYGVQKVQMLKLHPGAVKPRQLVAPIFVAALVGLPLMGLIWQPARSLLVLMLVAYLACAALASLLKRADAPLGSVMAAFFIIHVAWGLGFWRGVLK